MKAAIGMEKIAPAIPATIEPAVTPSKNNQRVQRYGVGHQKWLKEVTLDLLDQQDNDQHDQTER